MHLLFLGTLKLHLGFTGIWSSRTSFLRRRRIRSWTGWPSTRRRISGTSSLSFLLRGGEWFHVMLFMSLSHWWNFCLYSKFSQMKKRPASAVGYKRPISQFARVAIAMGAHSRYRVRWSSLLKYKSIFIDELLNIYERNPLLKNVKNFTLLFHLCVQAENIMFLELDMCPPNPSPLDCSVEADPNQTPSLENSPTRNRDIHKSSSWWAPVWTLTVSACLCIQLSS